MLDPELINIHAEHFKTTFGGQPPGIIETGINPVQGTGGSPTDGQTTDTQVSGPP